MDLKERVRLAITMFGLLSAYCLYSISEVLFLGCFFGSIGAYCYCTCYHYYKERARTVKRLKNHFTEPPNKKGMLTTLMILSFACGFIFMGLCSDCLSGVFI